MYTINYLFNNTENINNDIFFNNDLTIKLPNIIKINKFKLKQNKNVHIPNNLKDFENLKKKINNFEIIPKYFSNPINNTYSLLYKFPFFFDKYQLYKENLLQKKNKYHNFFEKLFGNNKFKLIYNNIADIYGLKHFKFLHDFNIILNTSINYDILIIFNNLNKSILETLIKFCEINQYNSEKNKYFAYELKYFNLDNQEYTDEKSRKKFLNNYIVNYNLINDNICNIDFINTLSNQKYHISILNILLHDPNNIKFTEYRNIYIQLIFLLISIKSLHIGGTLIINIYNMYSNLMIEIISFICNLFKNVFIHKDNVFDKISSYKVLIAKDFKGISNIDLKNFTNIVFSILKFDKSCGFLEIINPYQSFYDIDFDIIKTKILFYNKTEIFKKIYYLEKIKKNYLLFLKTYKTKNIKFFNKLINDLYIKKISLNKSFLNKYSLLLFEQQNYPLYYKKYTELYNINILKLKIFERNSNNFKINLKKNQKLKNLDKISGKLKNIKRQIDSANLKQWEYVTNKISIFKNLKYIISNNYIKKNISQAFLKLLEIYNIIKIIDPNLNNLNTFHMCEAPGQFILATKYFIKNKTKIKNHKWLAQSLNPNNEENKKKYNNIISDTYNLIKNNPKKWIWGCKNTGDITDPDNIRSYAKNLKNCNLITSDCGLPTPKKQLIYQDTYISKVNYCQIVFILVNLPKNGNFIFKTFLPMNKPYIISLMYILQNSFEKLHIYKPFQNLSSSELYIIGLKYNPINKIMKNKLLNHIANFNPYISLVDFNKFDNKFINEYVEYISYFININYLSINRSFFFYKNEQLLNTKYIKNIKSKKLNEWIQYFVKKK